MKQAIITAAVLLLTFMSIDAMMYTTNSEDQQIAQNEETLQEATHKP